ncbi:hypothetical protein OAM99_07695, partial [Planktomarina sp.]|nr:hypothetical protein [Planktomarina sp.]
HRSALLSIIVLLSPLHAVKFSRAPEAEMRFHRLQGVVRRAARVAWCDKLTDDASAEIAYDSLRQERPL